MAERKSGDATGARSFDNVVSKAQNKQAVPEIDFTIHTMDDGTTVSTLDRVIKGNYEIIQLLCVF